jgi:hypothetical protein
MRKISITQGKRIINYSSKVWVRRRLSITRKSKHIGRYTLGLHLHQFLFQSLSNLNARGQLLFGTTFGIEATLAIKTVKRTYLAIARQ